MIIANSTPIYETRPPFICMLLFIIVLIEIYKSIKRTGLVKEGYLAIAICSLFFLAGSMIEMEMCMHDTGRCKYEAVFTDDKPEDVLDVYEIIGQRGNIYILEDKLY